MQGANMNGNNGKNPIKYVIPGEPSRKILEEYFRRMAPDGEDGKISIDHDANVLVIGEMGPLIGVYLQRLEGNERRPRGLGEMYFENRNGNFHRLLSFCYACGLPGVK